MNQISDMSIEELENLSKTLKNQITDINQELELKGKRETFNWNKFIKGVSVDLLHFFLCWFVIIITLANEHYDMVYLSLISAFILILLLKLTEKSNR